MDIFENENLTQNELKRNSLQKYDQLNSNDYGLDLYEIENGFMTEKSDFIENWIVNTNKVKFDESIIYDKRDEQNYDLVIEPSRPEDDILRLNFDENVESYNQLELIKSDTNNNDNGFKQKSFVCSTPKSDTRSEDILKFSEFDMSSFMEFNSTNVDHLTVDDTNFDSLNEIIQISRQPLKKVKRVDKLKEFLQQPMPKHKKKYDLPARRSSRLKPKRTIGFDILKEFLLQHSASKNK